MMHFIIIIFILGIALFPPNINAEDVSLQYHLEKMIEEQDRRFQQEQKASRDAIERALLNELRTQDRERDDRYALKEELKDVKTEIKDLDTSRNRVFGAILIIGIIGVANLVKLFWPNKEL